MTVLNGFVKIHRKLLAWGWYQDNVVKGVFIHILLMANFKDTEWMGTTIKSGQFVTSYKNLAQDLGFSVQQIRTAINKLKSTGEITIKTTNKFTIITVEKWEDYQVFDTESTSTITRTATNEQQTNNKQITNEQQTNNNSVRNKEIKNKRIKEIKEYGGADAPISKSKIFTPPTFEEVQAYCFERKNNVDAERFIDFYSAKAWYIGKNKMKDWKAAVRTWERREGSGNYGKDRPDRQSFTGGKEPKYGDIL